MPVMASALRLLPRRAPWATAHALTCRSISSTAPRFQTLSKTGLYDLHVAKGGKMVEFAGYSMPLLYGDVGQIESHNHVRTRAGLFDVGHMVQSIISGGSAHGFLEWLTPSPIRSLPLHGSTLSVLLNENGGIIDDLIVTKQSHDGDKFYVVTNAGRRERDLDWFADRIKEWNAEEGKGKDKPVSLEVLEDWGLVALQGPEAASVLQSLVDQPLGSLYFGNSAFMNINGVRVHVARGGYTGEDGFEISISPQDTLAIAEALSAPSIVQWTGLAARDSLRLEAGMCLYGHDLNEDIGPVEAGLSWLIGKERRSGPSANFIGAEHVLRVLGKGGLDHKKRRVGLIVDGPPAREGMAIYDSEGKEELGSVTSGIPSPTLGKNIAMGYVKSGWHKKGTELKVQVRKNMRPAVVTPMPFVAPKYYRGP
ncbi:glycine cleavage system T protein [Exidia glandulosa HHB12029]|uniref:Aminomethyltransferase n=1 Tax=Exidia glandulosa HHB12029 TaxID=1314781 RepID=A0A165NVR3_EXIGL|nr:glycine cleavage system T protein [Exidia glandulosa HHB12029]